MQLTSPTRPNASQLDSLLTLAVVSRDIRVVVIAVVVRRLVRRLVYKLNYFCRLHPRVVSGYRLYVRKTKTWQRTRNNLSTGDDDVPDI